MKVMCPGCDNLIELPATDGVVDCPVYDVDGSLDYIEIWHHDCREAFCHDIETAMQIHRDAIATVEWGKYLS